MKQIQKGWWKHLAPREIVPLRGEVQALLEKYMTGSAGAEWFKVANREGGVFRVRHGQKVPVFHVVFVRGRPPFVAPPQVVKPGHRCVGRATPLVGGELNPDELVLEPEIRVELVTDPEFIAASAQGRTKIDEATVLQPSLIFTCPARLLVAPRHSPDRSFVLYQHIFGSGGNYPIDGYFYVGVTQRSWQKRWAEHRRGIDSGSQLLFHRKFREELQQGRVTYINHKVMAVTDDLEKLYASEEWLVEEHWHDGRRLNMIPGGKSGLRYLRENGLLGQRIVPLPDERDEIVATWLEQHPRKGLPAPWVAERWRDNEWAVAQICGREGRLSVSQVRAIRALSKDYCAAEIAARIGAKNDAQVQRVIDGETYTRVD
ncbi:hypothetical protein [Luteolibacter soli]|uniref:GIY-YIG domain-containing protein n=1 Tax=Luteolibacter soli TaxID=3135280 RepID=A0ABU9B676_9BACT